MPRHERAPDMPTLGCACGYRTPPPWTEYHAAEHTWHHLMWDEIQRGFRKEQATYDQARDMVRAAGEFIAVLERRLTAVRGQLGDLDDELFDLRRRVGDLAEAGRRVCERWNDDDVDAGAMDRDVGQLRRAIDG